MCPCNPATAELKSFVAVMMRRDGTTVDRFVPALDWISAAKQALALAELTDSSVISIANRT